MEEQRTKAEAGHAKEKPEGRGSLVERYGQWFPVELREGGAKVEPKCQQAEVERWALRLKVEPGDPLGLVELVA